ncbi:MAG: DUF115 domain-containing protein, partial [Leptospiraceae bacterium]|nr:DUF115 domain-containing protein [Leptospiraceae bacterium]
SEFIKSVNFTKTSDKTISHFSNTWLRNSLIFLKNAQAKFIYKLNLKYKTIVFVGASPILEEELDTIKKFRDSFYLFSSDTALGFLQSEGLSPDLILSVDSGRGTFYHFHSYRGDTPILSWPGGNYQIQKLCGSIYYYCSSYPLDQLIAAYLNIPILPNPSMNVAGLAKSLCVQFEASKLIYAGVSFASYKGKSHCRGTGYEKFRLPGLDRYHSLYSYSLNSYRKEKSDKDKLAYSEILKNETNLKTYLFSDFQSQFVKEKYEKMEFLTHTLKDTGSIIRILDNTDILNGVCKELQIEPHKFKEKLHKIGLSPK